MKKIFFFLFISVNSIAQTLFPIDSLTGNVNYSQIVEAENFSKQELFSNAKLYIANSFSSGKDVLQLSDLESGIVIGKAKFELANNFISNNQKKPIYYDIKYKFTISTKDEKFKILISEITLKTGNTTALSINEYLTFFENKLSKMGDDTKIPTQKFLADIDAQITMIMTNIKKSMLKKNNEW